MIAYILILIASIFAGFYSGFYFGYFKRENVKIDIPMVNEIKTVVEASKAIVTKKKPPDIEDSIKNEFFN